MAMSVDEIREYRTHLINNVYSKTKGHWEKDLTYIDDTFDVPEIKPIDGKQIIYRSGYGVRIVDAPADQIVTADPQVFVETTGRNKTPAEDLAKYFNTEFIEILKRGNPNIWKEFNKGQLGRGVAYYKIIHNETWINKGMTKRGLPIYFIVLDPMVVYASPEEDDNGIPDKVVVQYERQIKDLLVRYPDWTNPKKYEKTKEKQSATWMEYWDKDVCYFEADGESVRPNNGGIYPNPYGITPFVRKYSGFGRRSPDGDLSSLIVSDIRYSRDLIREECVMRSNIESEYFLFAHPDLFVLAEGELPKLEDINAQMRAGGFNVNRLENFKGKLEWNKIEPSAAMSAHHQSIIAQLNQKHPFIMAGFPQGTSGRQQDMTQTSASRKYDSTVENCEVAFATALEITRIIIKEVPGLAKETGLSKAALTIPIQIRVKLKADDTVAQQILGAQGSRMYQAQRQEIDLRTNLVKYQGKTEAEAEEIMDNIVVDDMIYNDPTIRQLIALQAAKERGIKDEYLALAEQRKGLEAQPTGIGSEGGEPRIGNIKTLTGVQQIDMSLQPRPTRLPPKPEGVS